MGHSEIRPSGGGPDVFLSLDAEERAGGQRERPCLHLRCRNGGLEAFVRFALPVGLREARVQLAFDGEAAAPATWRLSADRLSAGPDPAGAEPLLGELLAHRHLTLVVGATSLRPIRAEFELEGLAEAAGPLFAACRPADPALARRAARIVAEVPRPLRELPPGSLPPAALPETRRTPRYTLEARRAGLEGEVELEVVVLPDGDVGTITILSQPDPDHGLGEAAVAALRTWHFAPARNAAGEALTAVTTVTLSFALGKD